jgi:hypothetical protein
MVNGIELTTTHYGVMLLSFDAVAFLGKTVTSGTAYFSEKDIGKPAILVVPKDSGRQIWVTDPGQMERLWGAYKYWVEGPQGTPLSM